MPEAHSSFEFHAVTDAGPRRLTVPCTMHAVDEVYAALDLGVYSSLRTFEHSKFLDLDGHIARTVRSMRAKSLSHALDVARLRRALDAACRAHGAPEARVRFDVLAAPATALGSDSVELICLRPFSPPPPELYTQGVDVRIARGLARADPAVKDAAFVEARAAHLARARAVAGRQPYEWLLEDGRGGLLEGVSSNFYAVRGGELLTAGAGVLEGITRRIVLEQAARAGVRVVFEALPVSEVDSVDEAAISSSSRGLMPVVSIDGLRVGAGRPGPVVSQLVAAYDDYVRGAVRPAVAD